MKHVNRINQFLLKHYPLVWNTKLVWLILAGLFFHLFFFGLGFLNLNNPLSLQEHRVVNNFFENGAVLLNIFISTILIVAWLFFMFKNNSFKNFYPTSKNQLFRHFVFYFIIIIFNISYYYSFFYGMKASVNLNHPSLVVEEDINVANQAAPFFSHHLNQYEINHKSYPLYLTNLFCETHSQLINFEKPHFSFLEEDYQFYTLYGLERNIKHKNINRNNDLYVSYEPLNDSILLYYYKDTVIDVSNDIPTTTPSYFNFSEVFFNNNYRNNYSYNYYTEPSYNRKLKVDSLTIALAESHSILLLNNNHSEIKSLLKNFLHVADKYKIATNLTIENWFPLINTDSFLIKNLIKNEAPNLNYQYGNQYNNWDRKQQNKNDNRLKTIRSEYISLLKTDFYLESDELRNVFSNIKNIKEKNPFENTIHFFMWFSFFLASLVFIYRISGLKSFIFSIITVGVLCILLTMIGLIFGSLSQYSPSLGNFMASFTWIIGTAILAIPIFYLKNNTKMISSICINISLSFFALYTFLILLIISMIQDYFCKLKYATSELRKLHCNNILEDVGILWSYILFIVAFIFIYFFSETIRKWRALPENK